MRVEHRDWLKRAIVADAPISGPDDRALRDAPAVRAAFDALVAAGAEMICTPTIAAHRLDFDPAWHDRCEDLVRTSASIACGAAIAAAGPVIVVGQIGPSGRILAVGEIDDATLGRSFVRHARWLADCGVDAVLLSGFIDLAELVVAIGETRGAVDCPVMAAPRFDSGADRLSMPSGASANDVFAALVKAGADVIGCDCVPPELALTLVQSAVSIGQRPVFVRTNAGNAEWIEGRSVYSETPAEFGQRGLGLFAAGATIIAGCCGATVEHIAALRNAR